MFFFKVEKERREKELQEEKTRFLEARIGLHEARLKRAREEAIFFFEEGRKLDKVAVETEEEKMRRKAAVYKDVEGVLVEQMGEKLKEKTRMEALKRLEQEERLGSEARVKEMEKEEIRKEQVGKDDGMIMTVEMMMMQVDKAQYGQAVLSQREADVKRREEEMKRRVAEDEMVQRHFRKLDSRDAREAALPLPVLYN